MAEIFENDVELREVRTKHLNPTILLAKANDVKITTMQALVYKSFKTIDYDPNLRTLKFESFDGTPSDVIDFNLMFQQLKHGVDVKGRTGTTYPEVDCIDFTGNVEVSPGTNCAIVNIPELTGEAAPGRNGQVKNIQLRGNLGMSELDVNGNLTIDLPIQPVVPPVEEIEGQIGTGTPAKINKVQILGYTKDSTLTNDTLSISIPDYTILQGKIGGAATYQDVRQLRITGNTASSSFTSGEMVVNIPFLLARKDAHAFGDVGRIEFTGYTDHVTISGQTTSIKGMQPLSVLDPNTGTEHKRVKEITFANADIQVTDDGDDNKVLVTPRSMFANVDGTTTYTPVSKIDIIGNRGSTKIENGKLTIDLPVGGGGGPGGSLTGTVDKPGGAMTGDITAIEVSGEVTNSEIDGNTLKIDIPYGGSLTVIDKDESKTYTAVTKLEYENAQIVFDSTDHKATVMAKPLSVLHKEGVTTPVPVKEIEFVGFTKDNAVVGDKAQIHIPDIQAEIGIGGTTHSLTTIQLTGSTAQSTLVDGVLNINIPSGGGGGGTGGPITGKVGSVASEVETVEVIGNLKNSRVDAATKTLKINIPDKPAFTDGTSVEDDVDLVQVAHSTLEVVMDAGKRKAVITPQVVMFYNGWFPSMDELEKAVPLEKRIPTKTCAYVMDLVTNPSLPQHKLYVWMTNTGTGKQEWQEVMVNGSLPFKEGGDTTGRVLSITKNNMVTINNNTGELTILDVSVPKVLVDIKNGPGTITKGHFTKLSFSDGPSWANLDTNTMELTLQRPIRRGAYGVDVTGKHPEYGDRNYEGTIVFNQDHKTWWGYDDVDSITEQHKWKPIAYGGMADDVKDLLDRVPQKLKLIDKVGSDDDDLSWKTSGWTGVPKHATGILPPHVQGQTGMVIQTFMGPTAAPGQPDQTGRIQIGYLGSDASMYKRHRDQTMNKWSDWVKISFNPGDLAEHNKDVMAHRQTHPFYKAFTFGMTYKALADDNRYAIKHVIDSRDVKLIATDGRPHRKDHEHYIKIPYDGRFDVRGLIYIGGKSDMVNTSIPGFWTVALQKCPVGSSVYSTLKTLTYDHNSTTLKYPPFSFKFDLLDLKKDEGLRIKIQFTPKSGGEAAFITKYPELWIMPGRSFISIDEDGQEIGFCLAESMSSIYGAFVPMGGGAFSVHTGTWPNDKGTLYADGLEDAVAAG